MLKFIVLLFIKTFKLCIKLFFVLHICILSCVPNISTRELCKLVRFLLICFVIIYSKKLACCCIYQVCKYIPVNVASVYKILHLIFHWVVAVLKCTTRLSGVALFIYCRVCGRTKKISSNNGILVIVCNWKKTHGCHLRRSSVPVSHMHTV